MGYTIRYTDSENAERLKEAQKKEKASQPLLDDAFKALGFNPAPLGADKQKPAAQPKKKSERPKSEGEKAEAGLSPKSLSDPSPYAHVRSQPCVPSVSPDGGAVVPVDRKGPRLPDAVPSEPAQPRRDERSSYVDW